MSYKWQILKVLIISDKKHVVFAYSKKQDQPVQQSYYSILKILSTIMSLSLPINTTSRIEEKQQRTWTKKEEKRKVFVEKHTWLREFILCDIQSTCDKLQYTKIHNYRSAKQMCNPLALMYEGS